MIYYQSLRKFGGLVLSGIPEKQLNMKSYCWLVRVTLVVAFGFLPQNLGGGGDIQLSFCSKRKATLMVLTM